MGRIQFGRKDVIINFFHVLNVKGGLAFGFEENSVNLKGKCFSYICSVAGKETFRYMGRVRAFCHAENYSVVFMIALISIQNFEVVSKNLIGLNIVK